MTASRFLYREIAGILAMPDVRTRILATGGYMLCTTTPQELHARTEQDAARWASLIRTANSEPQ